MKERDVKDDFQVSGISTITNWLDTGAISEKGDP